MNPLQILETLRSHPWYGKLIAQLSPDGVAYCEDFISRHPEATPEQFNLHVARLYMNQVKPLEWKAISDVLTAVSNIYRRDQHVSK